jgi:hypothetical protein
MKPMKMAVPDARTSRRGQPAERRSCLIRASRRGSFLLELTIGLALFSMMAVLVTQLLVARVRAEHQLELEARRIHRAQYLMEHLSGLAFDQLDPANLDQTVQQQLEQLPPDPYLRVEDGAWQVAVEPFASPLPGVKMVVRYQPAGEPAPTNPPAELTAWRFFPASPMEVSDP